MSPLSLSDAELDVIMNLAAPLNPALRDPFLRAVAIELARYPSEAISPLGCSTASAASCSGSSITPALGAVPRSRAW